MNWMALLFLAPYLISLAISSGVGVYAWRHRREPGARPYAVVAFSQAVWTAGYILELFSPNLNGKLFWDNFQWIASAGWGAGLLFFVYEYTHMDVPRGRLILVLLSIPLFLVAPLAFLDTGHQWIHAAPRLIPAEPFATLTYDFPLLVWLFALYGYLLIAGSISVLLIRYIRSHSLYRAQIGLVIVGNAIPLAGTFLTLVGVVVGPYRDLTPITFALGNLIVAWSLFRYHLFDLVPIARGALIEGMTDAVFVLDAAGRVVDLNPAASQALGVKQTEAIGQPAERVFARWPDLVMRYRQADQLQAEIVVEQGGDSLYLDLKLQSVRDARGRLTSRLILARDVTDRHRAQEELKARTRQLEDANERLQILSVAKDEFVSNVSHELRTPINNLKLHLGLVALRQERQGDRLPTLRREVDRLGHMIDSLLLLSRLDQRQIDLTFAPFELNSMLEEYVADRQQLAARHGLALTFQALNEPLSVTGERGLIEQVLSILVTNALNYTPVGGRIVVTALRRPDEQWAGFSVADTGPGISAQERERLFTRFFRGEAGRTSQIAGTGLGLALAREIIDRHHGEIEVHSPNHPGRGTIFSVWLPVAACI